MAEEYSKWEVVISPKAAEKSGRKRDDFDEEIKGSILIFEPKGKEKKPID